MHNRPNVQLKTQNCESSPLKHNLSKCNKGNGVLRKLFSPLIFFILCGIQEIDEFVLPQIFHLPEYY